jgi:hypothetical protein
MGFVDNSFVLFFYQDKIQENTSRKRKWSSAGVNEINASFSTTLVVEM